MEQVIKVVKDICTPQWLKIVTNLEFYLDVLWDALVVIFVQ